MRLAEKAAWITFAGTVLGAIIGIPYLFGEPPASTAPPPSVTVPITVALTPSQTPGPEKPSEPPPKPKIKIVSAFYGTTLDRCEKSELEEHVGRYCTETGCTVPVDDPLCPSRRISGDKVFQVTYQCPDGTQVRCTKRSPGDVQLKCPKPVACEES